MNSKNKMTSAQEKKFQAFVLWMVLVICLGAVGFVGYAVDLMAR